MQSHVAVLIALAIPVWLWAVGAKASGRIVESIVAVVNGEAILLSELEEAIRSRKAPGLDLPSLHGTSQREVLDELINMRLIGEEVERRGLTATPSTIDGAIEVNMRQNAIRSAEELRTALASMGMTVPQYRESLKRQIEVSRIVSAVIRPKVRVTDEDVLAEYTRRRGGPGGERYAELQMIFRNRTSPGATYDSMEKLRGEIAGGTPFADVADRESEGPGKGAGGRLGGMLPSQLQPELAEAVNSLKAGEVSPVISTDAGYYLVRVEAWLSPNDASIPESRRSALFAELEQRETERQLELFVRDLRAKAQIEVRL